MLVDDESVSMATDDKAKDIESIAAKNVATENTTKASKVSLIKSPKFNVTVVVTLYHISIIWTLSLLQILIVLFLARKTTE